MTKERAAKIKKVLSARQKDLTIVFENIHDPHNVSAILRTCDAVGVGKVHLLYTQEAFPKLGKKSSASAKKWIEVVKWKSTKACFGKLKKEGFSLVATSLENNSKALFALDLKKKIALVLGNEHRGVSPESLEFCDQKIYIPMVGMVQSLNVSVAAGVILYEAFRQRKMKRP